MPPQINSGDLDITLEMSGPPGPSPVVSSPPTTSSSTGMRGQIAYDNNYIYICISTNVWKRTAINTW